MVSFKKKKKERVKNESFYFVFWEHSGSSKAIFWPKNAFGDKKIKRTEPIVGKKFWNCILCKRCLKKAKQLLKQYRQCQEGLTNANWTFTTLLFFKQISKLSSRPVSKSLINGLFRAYFSFPSSSSSSP